MPTLDPVKTVPVEECTDGGKAQCEPTVTFVEHNVIERDVETQRRKIGSEFGGRFDYHGRSPALRRRQARKQILVALLQRCWQMFRDEQQISIACGPGIIPRS